jgi:hypothetical protein
VLWVEGRVCEGGTGEGSVSPGLGRQQVSGVLLPSIGAIDPYPGLMS